MEKIIKKYQDHIVDEATQDRLNQPLKDQTGFNDGHEDFLKDLIQKLSSGVLDSLKPETLYNTSIYSQLTDDQKEKADLTAINLMGVIRQIEKLWNLEKKATFQIQNLVETVFQMKSRFESEYGDVYII